MEIFEEVNEPNREEMSYIHLLRDVLNHGVEKGDRTGTGIIELSGKQLRFDLSNDQFPLLTTKKVHLKSIIHELLWFIKGDTNTKYLKDNNVNIWNEWADENGNLGKVYGYQWRKWNGKIDQLSNLIYQIRTDPNGRRHIITAWNPSDLSDCKLPPCHCFMQFIVRQNKLDCMLTQRSGDLFLGVPFNIASYSLFTKMIAKVCNLEPGEFIHTINSAHIYKNHVTQVKEQMTRIPFKFPKLKIARDISNIDDFKFEDFELIDYKHHDAIKAPVAV